MPEECTHLDHVRVLSSDQPGCEDCLATGGTWVHLRLGVECGRIGCCDNSANRHATRHYQGTGHPVIRAYDPDEGWWYCYVDELTVEVEGAESPRAGG